MYRNITSSFASNWRETWPLILREKTWAESVRKQAAGVIFVPETDEVTRDWTKLRNEGLHDLYSWPYVMWLIKSRKTSWAGYMACMGSTEMLQCSCRKTLRKQTTWKT